MLWPLHLPRAQNLVFNFKFLHRRLSTISFLKKIGRRDNENIPSVNMEKKASFIYFGNVAKAVVFGIMFFHGCRLVKLLVKNTLFR